MVQSILVSLYFIIYVYEYLNEIIHDLYMVASYPTEARINYMHSNLKVSSRSRLTDNAFLIHIITLCLHLLAYGPEKYIYNMYDIRIMPKLNMKLIVLLTSISRANFILDKVSTRCVEL